MATKKKAAAKKKTSAKKATASKKKTTSAKTSLGSGAGALDGMEFVFGRQLRNNGPKHLVHRIESLGGTIATKVTESTSFVVTLKKGAHSAEVTRARALKGKGASVRVTHVEDLCKRIGPSAAELLELLRGGAKGVAALKAIVDRPWNVDGFTLPSLTGADLRGLSLANALLYGVELRDADLRKADLSGAHLAKLVGCDLREAKLGRCNVEEVVSCDLRDADLESSYMRAMEGSDLRGAKLHNASLSYSRLEGCNLEDARLAGADLNEAKLGGSNLRGASLREARLERAVLTKADLTGADLTGAMLNNADLSRAVLSNALLDSANLGGADLSGAKVDGASFVEANLAGAKVPSKHGKAKGLKEALEAIQGEIGPRLRELETIAKAAERIRTSVVFDLPDGSAASVEIDAKNGNWSRVQIRTQHKSGNRWTYAESLTKALQDTANRWGKGTLRVADVTARTSKSPVSGKEMRHLATAAWCEVCGIEPPAAPAPKSGKLTKAQRRKQLTDALLEQLCSGPEGVKAWNDRSHEAWAKLGKDAVFARSELTGAKLDGVSLSGLDLSLSTFDGASMRDAVITDCNLDRASLAKADLAGASITKTKMTGADLSGATLDGATLTEVDLGGDSKLAQASLVGAKLPKTKIVSDSFSGTKLVDVDLSGSDLSGARITYTKVSGKYDGYTRFPPNFKPPKALTGPRDAKGFAKAAAGVTMDIEEFLNRLKTSVGTSRLKKATKLLKRSKFKLFHDVDDTQMIAVVKSETDASLLYACRLAADGYSCCTHNLNRCGGLSVGPCKHMMVMIVGLAKAGEIDPEKADEWVQKSKKVGPRLDKDAMAEIFLRYKGAEAGEIDWRPTETVPEDYYAF